MALDRQGALILTCELTFRGVGTPPNVYTEYVEPLTEMTRVRKGVADAQTHPATCLLSWGTEFPHFKGVMESLATTYVEFADDGTPLKAICEIRMLHVGKAKADVQDPESDPTRPRDVAPPTPVVEPKPDETLDIHWPPQEDPSTPVEPPAAERLSGEDDPLGAYLDRVDDALDRLESHDPPVEPAPAATPPTDDARPLEDPTGVDSLEGTLSALEEALDKLSLEPVDPVEAVPTADDGNAAETAGESLETPDAVRRDPHRIRTRVGTRRRADARDRTGTGHGPGL